MGPKWRREYISGCQLWEDWSTHWYVGRRRHLLHSSLRQNQNDGGVSFQEKNTMLIGFYVVCDNDLCAGFSPFMGETDGETFSNINRWLVNNQTSPNSAIILIFCTGLFCISVWTMTSRSQSLTTSPARQKWANNPHLCPFVTLIGHHLVTTTWNSPGLHLFSANSTSSPTSHCRG